MATHWAVWLCVLVGGAQSFDDDLWRLRLNEQGQVVGYADHPHEIEFEGRRVHIFKHGLQQVDTRAKSRRGGAALSNGEDAYGEFLVKLAAPVHHQTVAAVKRLVNATPPVAGAPPAWVEHAARNTLVIHTSAATASMVGRVVPRVVWVGPVNDDLAPYMKLHHSVWEQQDTHPRDASRPRSAAAQAVQTRPYRYATSGTGKRKVSETDPTELHVSLRAALESHEAVLDGAEEKIKKVVAASIMEGCPAPAVEREGIYITVKQVAPDCSPADLWDVAVELSTAPEFTGLIHAVEHPGKHRVTNVYSREVMTTGKYRPPGAELAEREPYAHLRGEGMVIGVADTGIDHDHCFFHDPKVATPVSRVDRRHRKIITYKPKDGDSSEDAQSDADFLKKGHGTHVAGTIAGSMTDEGVASHPEMEKYHGFVPLAKVTMIDLAGRGGSAESIWLPGNTEKYIYATSHDVGAVIHSNSWGSALHGRYSSTARQLDSFAFNHPTDVLLVSSGNEADKECASDPEDPQCDKRTVISPAVAKNALCIGASFAPQESWEEMGLGNYYINYTDPVDGAKGFYLAKGYFGSHHPTLPTNLKLIKSDPYTGCDTNDGGSHDKGLVHNKDAIKGNIVLVKRGVCFFAVKVKEMQEAGAAGVVVVNNVNGDPIVMGVDEHGDPEALTVPSYMVSNVDGKVLEDFIDAHPGGETPFSITLSHKRNPHKTEQDMSEFSSRGPTSDLRFKPDVAAIGYYVHSARSDSNVRTYNCDLSAQMGTSMACPEASGLTAKIHEHLVKVERMQKDDIAGATLRAMVVQSAVPLRGLVDRNAMGDWEQLSQESPDFYQGHGRIQLNTILGLENNPVDVAIKQSEIGTGDGIDWHCVMFNAEQERPGEWIPESTGKLGFRATLVWTDAPSSGSTYHQVLADLDLIVKTPSGHVYYGNAKGHPSDHVKDSLNNVEKVTIRNAPSGAYQVGVRAFSIQGDAKQKYSVVASGLSGGARGGDECAATVAAPCVESSFCSNGREAGDAIPSAAEGEVDLPVWGWKVLRYVSEGGLTGVKVAISSSNPNADVDIFIRKGAPPTFLTYDQNYDSTCSKCFGADKQHKELTHRIASDKVGDLYFIAFHAQCCHPTTVSYTIASDLPNPDQPILSSLSRLGDAEGRVLFPAHETIHGGAMVLRGVHLGSEEVQAGIAITYHDKDGHILSCEPLDYISDTEVHCLTQPGSFNVAEAVVKVTLNGYTMTSTDLVTFMDVTPDRYDIYGVRATPCEEVEACIPNARGEVIFNSYISGEGAGVVYIVGRNIGERAPGSSKQPAAVVTLVDASYDHPDGEDARSPGERATVVAEYVSDDVLKVLTRKGMTAARLKVRVSIFGVDVMPEDEEVAVIFAPHAQLTGITLVDVAEDPDNAQPEVMLSFAEVATSEVALRLYGVNIGNDDLIDPSSRGWVEADTGYEVPEENLQIWFGQYPGVDAGQCTVKMSTTYEHVNFTSSLECLLPKDPEGRVLTWGQPIYFKVREYGVDESSDLSMYIVGKPSFDGDGDGVSLSQKGPFGNSVEVPSYFPTLESTHRRIYLHGHNLGRQGEFVMLRFSNTVGEITSKCHGLFESDFVISCEMEKHAFEHSEVLVISAIIGGGGYEVHTALTVSISQDSGLEGLAVSASGPWRNALRVGAGQREIYVKGDWTLLTPAGGGTEESLPVVIVGGRYNCGGGVMVQPKVFKCTTAAGASGHDLHVEVFVMGSDIAETKLNITFDNVDRSGSEPVDVQFAVQPVVAGWPVKLGVGLWDESTGGRHVIYEPVTAANRDHKVAFVDMDAEPDLEDSCARLAVYPEKGVTLPLYGYDDDAKLPNFPMPRTAEQLTGVPFGGLLLSVCVSKEPGVWREALEPVEAALVTGAVLCHEVTSDVTRKDACPNTWMFVPGKDTPHLAEPVTPPVFHGMFPHTEEFTLAFMGMGLGNTQLAVTEEDCPNGTASGLNAAAWYTVQEEKSLRLWTPGHGNIFTAREAVDAAKPYIRHPKADGLFGTLWNLCLVFTVPHKVGGPPQKQQLAYQVGRMESHGCIQTPQDDQALEEEATGKSVSYRSPMCSLKGLCSEDGACRCDAGVRGVACEKTCPRGPAQLGKDGKHTSKVCNGAGTCTSDAACECNTGYLGTDCSMTPKRYYTGALTEEKVLAVADTQTLPTSLDWDLYAVSSFNASALYVGLSLPASTQDSEVCFDVLVWGAASQVGMGAGGSVASMRNIHPGQDAAPEHGEEAHVTSAAYVKVDLAAGVGEGGLYIGVYPSQRGTEYSLALSTVPPEEWSVNTPAPEGYLQGTLHRAEQFSKDYKALAVVAGFAIGIVTIGVLVLLVKLFLLPYYLIRRARAPQMLDEDASSPGEQLESS